MLSKSTITLLFCFAACGALVDGALADQCRECHNTSVFKVKHKAHYDYHVGYETSVHGLEGLGCADCHGGDADETDKDTAHEGVRESVMRDNIPGVCGSCHDSQYEAFLGSGHFQALNGERDAPHCASCHGSMEMDVMFVSKVKKRCKKCHDEDAEDDVITRTDELMSRVNAIMGYKGLVEADCKDPAALAALEESFERMTLHWHRFDFDQADEESFELLARLRGIRVRQKEGGE
ncbi:MAG: ammonia-forming cytochrome c nitrite reductase subunit c552 [Candidatus Krumholzibacteriota bacterium]